MWKLFIVTLLFISVFGVKKEETAQQHAAKEIITDAKHQAAEVTEQIRKVEELLNKDDASKPTIWERVGQIFGKGKDMAQEGKEKVEPIPDQAKNAFENQYETMKEKGHEMKEKVEEKVGQAKESLQNKMGEMKESVHEQLSNMMGKGKEFTEQEIPSPSTMERVKDKLSSILHGQQDTVEQTKEKAYDLKEKGKEKAYDLKEKGKEKAQELKDKAQELKEKGKEKVQELKDKGKEKAQELKDKAKEQTHSTIETLKEKVGNLFEGSPQNKAAKVEEEGISTAQKAKEKLSNLFYGQEEDKTGQQQSLTQQLQTAKDTIQKAKEDLENKMKNLEPSDGGFFSGRLFGGGKSGMSKEGEKMMENIRTSLDHTKKDMDQQIQHLNQLMQQCQQPNTLSKFHTIQDSIGKYMNDLWGQVNSLSEKISNDLSAPFKRWSKQTKDKYLLEACKYMSGLTVTYINDNGDEALDVTGENATESFDQLSSLNEFRQEFNLPHADSLQNVSVYIHQLKQPRVLVKAINVIDDIQYRYQYDNGKESLNVTLTETAAKSPIRNAQDQNVLNVFRLAFGIAPKQIHPFTPLYHSITTDKLLKEEL